MSPASLVGVVVAVLMVILIVVIVVTVVIVMVVVAEGPGNFYQQSDRQSADGACGPVASQTTRKYHQQERHRHTPHESRTLPLPRAVK